MDEERLEALREAVENRRKKESLEEAVGRVARKRGLDFSAYVNIMSEVRELARDSNRTLDEAAKVILRKGSQDAE
jgi:hypothetical protein